MFRTKLRNILDELKATESIFDFKEFNNTKNEKFELHFSKNLLEILNKSLASSSVLSSLPRECWLNNKHVYKIIEVCICEFYMERY